VFYDRPGGQFYADSGTTLPVFGLASVTKQTAAKPVYGLSRTNADPWDFLRPPIQIGLDSRNGLIGVPAGLTLWDPEMRTQYAFNYFFGIQQSLANNWAVEANYTGSQGRKLYMHFDVNRYAGDVFDGRLDRLNSSFGGIGLGQARSNSYYNGANFSVKKRYGAGLDLQAAYTVGKAIDYASSHGNGLPIVDIFNLELNRGLADFDIRQKLAVSLLYQVPKIGNGITNAVLGNWQVGSVVILQSGRPFSVNCSLPFQPVRNAAGEITGNNGCDFNADGFNNDFMNVRSFGFDLGETSKDRYVNGLFQASDFPKPAVGQPGNLARNPYIGPGYANTNLNLLKRFPALFLGEQGQIDFRAEFFNLLNRVNLGQPTGAITSSQFGRVTTALGGRNVQFGLRVAF
jgi:hypothetical protein